MPPNPHPLVVHFTIALFSVSVLCDVLAWLLKKESLHTVGWWNLLFGFLGAIVTVITGLFAESSVGHNEAAHAIMETHKTLGLIVLGLMTALFLWRAIRRGIIPQKLLAVYLFIAVVGVGVMATGAYFGGELVYAYGVGVRAVPETMEHEHEGGGHQSHGVSPADPSQPDGMEERHVVAAADSVIGRCDMLIGSGDPVSAEGIGSAIQTLAGNMKFMAFSLKATMKNLAALVPDQNTMKDQTLAEHLKILQKHLAEMAQEMEGATQQLEQIQQRAQAEVTPKPDGHDHRH